MKPKYLLFRLSIAIGLLLGLLLLIQTVLTYRFVSHSLLRQEAVREAQRRMNSINRSARLTGARESTALTPVLHELVHEAPAQIAWIRIIDLNGNVIAESEPVVGAPLYSGAELRRILDQPNRQPDELATKSGPALIAVMPLRSGPPPFAHPPNDPSSRIAGDTPPSVTPPNHGRGPRNMEIAEIAILLDGVSTNFGLLRQNLILGCAAAFALLGAVVVIGVRFRYYMRGKHIEEEISLARRVQLDLFPTPGSMAANLDFAAACVPAYQVGGDLYDVFETDDGEIALILGDVSGKGLPAALLMGVVQGAVRASSGAGAAENHEHAAERLNHLLCMKTARERFVSLFWCLFDPATGRLRYINAGHLPPLLIRAAAGRTEVLRLDEGGPVLGLLPGIKYHQAEVASEPGDLLIVFSDGILEAANAADEEFGESRVVASVESNHDRQPRDICAGILESVKAFLGKESPQDDQTILVVRLDAVSGAVTPPRTAERIGAAGL